VGANGQARYGKQRINPTLEPQGAIVGPDGHRLTLSDLPPHDTKRWVPRRKAMVVFAVEGGLISAAEVCERYRLSPEEFVGWKRLIQKHGVRGLRATKAKLYRERE
jgi:hypothetical protein